MARARIQPGVYEAKTTFFLQNKKFALSFVFLEVEGNSQGICVLVWIAYFVLAFAFCFCFQINQFNFKSETEVWVKQITCLRHLKSM